MVGMADAAEESSSGSNEFASPPVKDVRVRATQKFMKAMQLEPKNAEHHLSLAQVFLDEGRHADALRWAESAVLADDSIDFQDFDAFFFMCVVHIHAKNYKAVDQVAERIQAVMPDDEDIKKYAAARFASLGFDLGRMRAFEPASRFVRAARRFDPNSKDLKELTDIIEKGAKLQSEFERAQNDTLIINPLKRLCAFQVYSFTEEVPENKVEEFIQGFSYELGQYPASSVAMSIDRLRVLYPASFDHSQRMLTDLRDDAQRAQYQPTREVSTNSGCFVVTAAFGTALTAEVFILQRYRDQRLVMTRAGRAFVKVYYRVGPHLASYVASHPRLGSLARRVIGTVLERLRKAHPELWVVEARHEQT